MRIPVTVAPKKYRILLFRRDLIKFKHIFVHLIKIRNQSYLDRMVENCVSFLFSKFCFMRREKIDRIAPDCISAMTSPIFSI